MPPPKGTPKSPEHREAIRQSLLARGIRHKPKVCTRCGVLKERSEYALRTDGTYRRSMCRACESELWQEWRRQNPEQVRDHNRRVGLRRQFGITVELYDDMLDEQDGKCAICRRPPKTNRRLHVDHDHASGLIRGLLCNTCNLALGQMEDDADRLRAAAGYLETAHLISALYAKPGMPSGVKKTAKL